MANSAPSVAPQINLFGWDTAFVISLTKANEAIKAQNSSPTTFESKVISKTNTVDATIQGKWGDWSLTTNSGGSTIALLCPITSGTFTSATDPGTSFDLSNTSVEMRFKLTYQQQNRMTRTDPTAKAGTGVQHNLVLRTQTSDPTDPVVSLINSTYSFPNANDPNIAKAICDAAFLQWFGQHLDQFQHVFSIFIVNQTADKDAFQWLKPTGTPEYAIASTGNLDTSALAVMAMTENRPAPPRTNQVDQRILQLVGKHAAFVISGPRFVEHWLLQGLLTMRPGTEVHDYVLSNDGLSWQNKQMIQWGTFPDIHGQGVPVFVDAGDFSLSLLRDQIEFSLTDLHWLADVQDAFTMHVDYTQFLTMSLKSGNDANGKPYKNVVTLDTPPPSRFSISTTVDEAKRFNNTILSIVVGIVGSIVGGVLGGIADALTESAGAALSTAAREAEEAGSETVKASLIESEEEVEMQVMQEEPLKYEEEIELQWTNTEQDISALNQMKQDGEPPSAIKSFFEGKVKPFGQSLWSHKFKLIVGFLAGAIPGVAVAVPLIIDAEAHKKYSLIPPLDEFAANCVESVHWPNAGGFTLTSATLSGAVVLGGDLTPATPSMLAARVPEARAVPAAAAGAGDAGAAAGDPGADDATDDIGAADAVADDTTDDDLSAAAAGASDDDDDDNA